MSAGNRSDGSPLIEGGGRSLDKNPDSPPPSYESQMTESTEHRDTCVAQTHPTNPTYPTLDIPLPSNPDCNSSDPRNETRPASAPYPTDESVYIPSRPKSSSAFYNPMNQIPSQGGQGIMQPTGETTQGPANVHGGFTIPERNGNTTVLLQYPQVDQRPRDCFHMRIILLVIVCILGFGLGTYISRWLLQRR